MLLTKNRKMKPMKMRKKRLMKKSRYKIRKKERKLLKLSQQPTKGGNSTNIVSVHQKKKGLKSKR